MGPDLLLRRCIENRLDTGAPALNLVDSRGRYYLKTCGAARCSSKIRHYSAKQRIYVCGKCGEPWPYRDRFMLKGQVQRSIKPDGHERFLIASRVDVGIHLDRMAAEDEWKWDLLLYSMHCMGWSGDEIAGKIREQVPECPGPLGRTTIYRRIARARHEWVARLEKAGILSPS